MTEINEQEFNEYCAEVEGYTVVAEDWPTSQKMRRVHLSQLRYWDDLNQLAPVVEKLVENLRTQKQAPELYMAFNIFIRGKHILQAFREFVWSTK